MANGRLHGSDPLPKYGLPPEPAPLKSVIALTRCVRATSEDSTLVTP